MSEYNPIVTNWAGRAKPAGLSFLIVNLGLPWTLPINQCSRGIVLNVCYSSSLEGNCHIRLVSLDFALSLTSNAVVFTHGFIDVMLSTALLISIKNNRGLYK